MTQVATWILSGSTAVMEAGTPDLREAELTDLLARLAGGDRDALGPIYDAWHRELYAAALWRTGSRADAADVVQDVFVKLASSHTTPARIDRPRRWLLTIAHRAAVDRLRKRRADAPLDEAEFVATIDADAATSADAHTVSRALASLPATQRETIYLHHYAELPFREIGKITGVPTFTAASRYRLGIAKLRRALGVDR